MIRSVTKAEVLIITETDDDNQETKTLVALTPHALLGFPLRVPQYRKPVEGVITVAAVAAQTAANDLASFVAHLEAP